MANENSASPYAPTEAEYRAMTSRALDCWAAQPGAGPDAPPLHDPRLLGLAVGKRFAPTATIDPVLAAIEAASAGDPRADPEPRRGLHVSFLAITRALYRAGADLPASAPDLVRTVVRVTSDVPFQLTHLRLVPLVDGLLLAGFPDPVTLAARAELTALLLRDATWAPLLRGRHPGRALPPVVWHATLLRYRAAFLSPALREVFHRFANVDLGALTLGPPALELADYTWTRSVPLASTRRH
jgi:hypothetical protein